MSETITVNFGGQTIDAELWDPATTAALALATGSAVDAAIAAAVALAAAATADTAGARAADHLARWQAAAGDGARWFHTADAPKTWHDDDPTTLLVEEITPLFGPAGVTAEQIGKLFDGSGPAPVPPILPKWTQADGGLPGLAYNHRTSFAIDDGIIAAGAGTWSIERIIVWDAVAATYPNMAAANAALGDHPVGTLIFVTPVVDNGSGPIPADAQLGTNTLPSEITGGYLLRGNGAWDNFNQFTGFLLVYDTAGAGGEDFCHVSLDSLGRLTVYSYDGALQSAPIAFYRDVIGFSPGEPQSIRLDCDGSELVLWWNGQEAASYRVAPSFTPNRIRLNGFLTEAGTGTSSINTAGFGFTERALSITEGLDYRGNLPVSQVLAELFGAPAPFHSDVVDIAVLCGQSELSGATSTVGDSNRPDSVSGYNGQIDGRVSNDPRLSNPSQEHLPGVYTFRDLEHCDDIGPLQAAINPDAINHPRNHTAAGGGDETWDWGFARKLRRWTGNHLYLVAATAGGASLAQIKAKNAANYLHALGPSDPGLPYYRDQLNRAVIKVVERIRKRGQRARIVLVANLQAKTDVGVAGTAAAHEADLRQWWDEELSQLVDLTAKPPLLLTMAPNYTYAPGTDLGTNTAGTNYVDDAYRRLAANKDGGHPLRAITSIWKLAGRWIHWARVRQRKIGEHIADLTGRTFYGGEFVDPLQPVSVAIGAGGDAGKIVITLNRAAATFTSIPDAPTIQQTGGNNTYGFVFAPNGGGRTINGAVTVAGTTIKIPISGGGPIAGDRIGFLGAGVLWGNIREAVQRTGEYPDQDFGATIPLPDAAPAFAEGDPNDLTEGLAAFTWVLA